MNRWDVALRESAISLTTKFFGPVILAEFDPHHTQASGWWQTTSTLCPSGEITKAA